MSPGNHDDRAEALFGRDGRLHRGWACVIGSMLALMVGPSTVAMMTFGLFVPELNESFHWGIAATGYGATILSLMIVVAAPLQGWLVDRFGVRRVILTCIPLFGLSFASLSLLTGALWQFYLLWVLIPLLAIGLWPGSYAKATSSWFDRRLGLAVAIATLGIGIGGACLPLVVDAILAVAGWRTAYAVLGIAAILISFPVAYWLVFENTAAAQGGAAAPKSSLRDWEELRQPDLYKLLSGFALLGLVSTAMLVHQVSVLTDNGVAPSDARGLQALLGFAAILGRVLAGWMLDRVHVRCVMPAYALIGTFALAMLGQGATGLWAGLAAICIGLLIGAEIDVLGFVVKRYFGLRRYGAFYGLIFSAFQIGGAAGAAVLGFWRASAGSYAPGLIMLAVLAAGSALIFISLAPYRHPGAENPEPAAAPLLT